ncbi:ABC transporter permease [Tropicimonas sp. IMCC34043]|uniref:ABC transporter permease n=1 Tax=Tropicimonas sp. IMCC34043 TaxID=2248760 RepID=UPI000E2243FD|nr:ABC transporter permease [Tropicimonas sp. IMCC34043]
MRNLWDTLSAGAQDSLITAGLLLPLAVIAAILLRGFAPWALVRAILWRFRWANLIFVLLISVSVGMGIGVIVQERGLRQGMAHAADKFDLVVSAPGSELTMTLATIFLRPSDVPLLSGRVYQDIADHENVDIAAPIAFGDSYLTAPLIGTIDAFVRHLGDGEIEGRMWQTSTEAIAGAAAPVRIGDVFTPVHGQEDDHDEEEEDEHGHHHDGFDLTVVGRLPPSGTPWDHAILIPVEGVWEVHGLANGHAPERGDRIGPPFDPDYFPGTPAVIVRSSALWANYALKSDFTRDSETMAFFPGTVLANLYRVMGDIRQAMSLMSLVTQGLVAASVLMGLFILTRLFQRQTAMLRALGAPRRFVMAVVWCYGASMLTLGTLGGILAGYATTAILSRIVSARTDVLVTATLGWSEIHLACGFLSGTALLSLLPAILVMRTPIAEGLRA